MTHLPRSEAMNEQNRGYVAGLRALANYIESHPEMDPIYTDFTLNLFPATKAEMIEIARSHAPVTKKGKGDWFCLIKDFGGGTCIEWNLKREQICERIVEKKTVTRPKFEAVGEETVEVEEVTWKCPESLLKCDGQGDLRAEAP